MRFNNKLAVAGFLLPTILTTSLPAQIYWAGVANDGTGRIYRCDLNGANILGIVQTGNNLPASVTLDIANEEISWTDVLAPLATGAIHRSNIDGSSQVVLIPDIGQSPGIAVNVPGNKMYWTRPDGVYRANLDGSDAEPFIPPTSPVHGAFGVAVDLNNDHIYWTEVGTGPNSSGLIRRANLSDGSNAVSVYDVLGASPTAIALDPRGGKMYWIDTSFRNIKRADLNGLNVQTLANATGAEFPAGIALDLTTNKVYWTLSDLIDGLGRIRRANLDGTVIENFLTLLIDPKGIAIRNAPEIAMSNPPMCAIDAQQPHDIGNAAITYGWNFIDLEFDDVLPIFTAADFSSSEIGGDEFAPSVVLVSSLSPSSVRVTFSTAIEPGAWTCVYHNGSGTRACVGYLPGDVNADGVSSPIDILRLIDFLNGVIDPPYETWQVDINRSGLAEPSDVLRVIDLLNGADAFEPWLSQSLPTCPN